MSRARPLLLALLAVAAVLVPYAALGGGAYAPAPVADPCERTAWVKPDGIPDLLEQLAVTGLTRAACELGVSREELVLALRSDEALDSFAREHGLTRAEVDRVVRAGVISTAADAEEAGDLPGLVAPLVRRAIDELPPTLVLETLERLGSLVP